MMTQRLRRKVHRPSLRLGALACAIALLVNGMAIFDTSPATTIPIVKAATSAELEQQKQEILDEQAALEALRNEAAATADELKAEAEIINQQIEAKIKEIEIKEAMIADLETQIEGKKTQIEVQEAQIALKEAAIIDKEAQILAEFTDLQTRLRELSKTTTLTSYMQLLISGDGSISGNKMTDYLVKNKMSELISENTTALLNQMEAELQALNGEKQTLETTKATLESQKSAFEIECRPYYDEIDQLSTAKEELDKLYSELNNNQAKLNQDIDQYNADMAANNERLEELEDQIQETIAKENGYSGSYNGGGSGSMGWPAYDCNYISSTFKFRWGRWHRGIDICGSGCYGTRINAAADGTVIYADWMSGYGLCIMIDHGYDSYGRNIVTLYAHSSALHVSYGQHVTKGQHISNIGTTGNVTGPHLHFEVRVDGTAVDPIANGYISTSGIIVDESL